MLLPFKIFPSFGYINGQFQVLCFDKDIVVTIEKDNKTILSLKISKKTSQILVGLNEPGYYTAKCQIDNHVFNQFFEVRNSIRLGTSELKSTYVFDDIPYSFFLMKDRMHIYDEKREFLFFENNISPTEIQKINNETILLVTRIGDGINEISNYGLYSLVDFNLIWQITDSYEEVFFDKEQKLLWVLNFNSRSLICFGFDSTNIGLPKELFNVDKVIRYNLKTDDNIIIVESHQYFTLASLDAKTTKTVEKADSISVGKNGVIYSLDEHSIRFENTKEKFTSVLTLPGSQRIDLLDEDFHYLGDKFRNVGSSEFEKTIDKIIHQQNPSARETSLYYTYRPVDIIEDTIVTIAKIIPLRQGTYLLFKNRSLRLVSITYKKTGGVWVGTPSFKETTTYDLWYKSAIINKVLQKGIAKFVVLYASRGLFVANIDHFTIFLRSDVEIKKMSSVCRVDPLLGINNNNYLLIKRSSINETFDLFSIIDNALLLENVTVLNYKHIELHKTIWYIGNIKNQFWRTREVLVFDLKTKRKLNIKDSRLQQPESIDATALKFYEQYCIGANGVLINVSSVRAIDAVIGNVVGTSESLHKVASRRGSQIYINFYNIKDAKFHEQQIAIQEEKYSSAYLSPDGNFLMLQRQPNSYIYYDIHLNQEIKFFSEKFIGFSKEGNLIFEEDRTRSSKIVDPLTWQNVTPPNYHHYRFLSPDGRLYGSVVVKRKYFDKIKEEYVAYEKHAKSISELDVPLGSSNESVVQKIQENREAYFSQYKEYFQKIGVNSPNDIRSYHVTRTDLFGEIGIVGTNVTAEIRYPGDLNYFNYGAFSYDSTYYGYVGKPPARGLIQIFKIDFDPEQNTLEIIDSYVSRLPNYACWVCGFSKLGYFATYDSTPITYIVKIDELTFADKWKMDEVNRNFITEDRSVYKKSYNWNRIDGKNFICFSPSGAVLALSEQGYEPLTLGGYGHQDSPALHLAATVNGRILHSFTEHGDEIREDLTSKISFVAFSEDENKLMSMSKDGVVIVRDISFIKQKLFTEAIELVTQEY